MYRRAVGCSAASRDIWRTPVNFKEKLFIKAISKLTICLMPWVDHFRVRWKLSFRWFFLIKSFGLVGLSNNFHTKHLSPGSILPVDMFSSLRLCGFGSMAHTIGRRTTSSSGPYFADCSNHVARTHENRSHNGKRCRAVHRLGMLGRSGDAQHPFACGQAAARK